MDDDEIMGMGEDGYVELRFKFEPNTEIITAARNMFEGILEHFKEAGTPWTIADLEMLKVVQTNTVITFAHLIDEEIARLRELGDTSDVVDVPDFLPEDDDSGSES